MGQAVAKDVINADITQEGSFAFVFKSTHFPDEMVCTRRGSPMLIGVKTDRKLKVDFVDVELGEERGESYSLSIQIPLSAGSRTPLCPTDARS